MIFAVLGAVGCVALFVMMVIALVDVVARNVLNKPVPAASEIIELAMVLTIFLIYPAISFKGLHISIDLLDRLLPEGVKRLQHVVVALLGIGVFCAIAWRVRFLATEAMSSGELTGVLGVPLGYVYGFISVMAVVASFAFAATIPAAFASGRFEHPTMPIDELPE